MFFFLKMSSLFLKPINHIFCFSQRSPVLTLTDSIYYIWDDRDHDGVSGDLVKRGEQNDHSL